ncbi:MAG: FAD-dependent oxidoreductase [Planctomycetes bacterium]|nr:FAD-dependent oxidoreductase [Planctomycetota bacterium]
MSDEELDLIVVGGGVGGAAAALRAAQYDLRVAWVLGDARTAKRSRGKYVFNVDNMIGVHPGVLLPRIEARLADHPAARAALRAEPLHIGTQDIIDNAVERVGETSTARILREAAVSAARDADGFAVTLASGVEVRAPDLVLSTGVMDRQPSLKRTLKSGRVLDDVRWIYPYANLERFLYCIRCEGHLTRDEPVAVIGASEGTAQIALMLHERYRGRPLLLTNGEAPAFSARTRRLLELYGGELCEERIVDVDDGPATEAAKGAQMHGLVLESGRVVRARFAMVALGLYRVYNELARELGAELEAGEGAPETRHVLIDDATSETSVRGLFCVGDMARRRDGGPLMKQVYTAQEYAVRAVDTLERRSRLARREATLGDAK